MAWNMRIRRKISFGNKLPLGLLFWTGVLAGIIVMNLGKSILLDDTGLLDEYTLYHMKYMTVDSGALFYYVLWLRMKTVLILIVFATTYLGMAVCTGATVWYGFSVGAFTSALMMQYGLKGIVFGVLSVFPQMLLYVPAAVALLRWCVQLNRFIYFQREATSDVEKKVPLSRRIVRLLGILGLVVLGCLAESFINPEIMEWLLNIF
ncbi:MAG: stage II sporulation protein M [Lachnospiraceae bacterium]|nr:stage II sporulation protein M [Lachnospiraceae bacterium]